MSYGYIPNLREISKFAFADNNLDYMLFVNLPELRLIGNGSFENTEIMRIKFSQLPNLKYIGSRSGYYLYLKNLPSLTRIEERAFLVLSNHQPRPAVAISNLNIDLSLSKNLQHIGNWAFSLVDVTNEIRERYINN